jgi:hypothetical protein
VQGEERGEENRIVLLLLLLLDREREGDHAMLRENRRYKVETSAFISSLHLLSLQQLYCTVMHCTVLHCTMSPVSHCTLIGCTELAGGQGGWGQPCC